MPPTLIPDIKPHQAQYESEKIVLRELYKLPKDFIVFYSFNFLLKNRISDPLMEGEVDFIIVHPKVGILVLEVKGGHFFKYEKETFYSRYPSRNEWKIVPRNPCDQARKNMHYVLDFLEENSNLKRGQDYSYGYAIVFPQCISSSKDIRAALPDQILIDALDLSKIQEKLFEIGGHFSRKDEGYVAHSAIKKIKNTLSPIINYIPAYGKISTNDEQVRLLLGQQQRLLLHNMLRYKKIGIQGSAGSGKTELALYFAIELAKANRSVLFLCYNKGLSTYLQRRLCNLDMNIRNNLTISSVISYIYKIKPKGLQLFLEEDKEAIVEQVVLAYDNPDYMEDLPVFDAIIIDEGQDFQITWLDHLRYFLKDLEKSFYYVFFDIHQALFFNNESRESVQNFKKDLIATLDLEEWNELTCNYRNPYHIASLSSGIFDVTNNLLHTNKSPIVYVSSNTGNIYRQNLIENKVRNLLISVACSQIVLISPYSDGGCMKNVKKIGGFNVVTDTQDWLENKGVLRTTARSFKGLEAGFIIIYDIDEIEDLTSKNFQQYTRSDLYVSCTRATTELTIITSTKIINILQDFEKHGRKYMRSENIF